MKESTKYNIRYVGFESLADGGRRLDYGITAQGAPARSASIHIPASAFTGPNRVTFQESATIGCEKIRRELEAQPEIQIATLTLSAEDIEEFRPRRRAAGQASMTDGSGAFHEFEHAGWEKAATEYDRRFGELTMQAAGPLLDAAGAAPGLRLLDVACGPGYVAAAAARKGSSVVGVDFSSAMVAIASALNPGLEFQEGDAEKLDLPDCSFDAVVMNFGMLHLERPESAIAEAFRVLRPGGRYAFTVWDVPEKAVAFGIILESIQVHGNMDVPLPAGPPFFRFSDPEESKRTLTAQGFVNVQTLQVPQTWKLESGEGVLATFRTAAVRTAALLNAQAPAALKKIQSEISSRVDAFRADDFLTLPMPAILTSALRPR